MCVSLKILKKHPTSPMTPALPMRIAAATARTLPSGAHTIAERPGAARPGAPRRCTRQTTAGTRVNRAFPGTSSETLINKGLAGRVSGDALSTRFAENWSGAVFQVMFCDALEPLYLVRLRAFYVFWLVCVAFGAPSFCFLRCPWIKALRAAVLRPACFVRMPSDRLPDASAVGTAF